MKSRKSLSIIAICLAIVSCGKVNDSHELDIEGKRLELSETTKGLIKGERMFAYNLLRDAVEQEEGSFVVSPLSVTIALGMLTEGAEESSPATQSIYKMLGFDGAGREGIREYCRMMMLDLPGLSKTTKVKSSNLVVADSRYGALDPGIKANIVSYYDSIVKSLAFSEVSSVVSFVNDWASSNTNGVLRNVISEHEVTKSSAILANSLYFHGLWTTPFDKSLTATASFNREDGSVISVQMMKMYEMSERFVFSRCQAYRTLSLPFGNQAFTMTFFLPEDGFTVKRVAEILSSGRNSEEHDASIINEIQIPRFKIEGKVLLADILNTLSGGAFGSCSFSLFENKKPLFVDNVFQVSSMSVDEAGAEAATVTAVNMTTGMTNVVDSFILDRPFLFSVSESSSGAVLFAGVFKGE